jgi:hypothetical protein
MVACNGQTTQLPRLTTAMAAPTTMLDDDAKADQKLVRIFQGLARKNA